MTPTTAQERDAAVAQGIIEWICAENACEHMAPGDKVRCSYCASVRITSALSDVRKEATEAERGRCAKVADEQAAEDNRKALNQPRRSSARAEYELCVVTAKQISEAIRFRTRSQSPASPTGKEKPQ